MKPNLSPEVIKRIISPPTLLLHPVSLVPETDLPRVPVPPAGPYGDQPHLVELLQPFEERGVTHGGLFPHHGKDVSRAHDALFLHGIFCHGPEHLLLFRVQDLHRVGEVDVLRDLVGRENIIQLHGLPRLLFGVIHRPPDEVEADPEVSGEQCPLHDQVEHDARDHPRIHPLLDPLLEDGPDLVAAVRRKIDLRRLHRRYHAGVQFFPEVGLDVAHRQDHSAPHPRELFVEPEDGEDRIVEHPFVEQVVRVVQADEEHSSPVP